MTVFSVHFLFLCVAQCMPPLSFTKTQDCVLISAGNSEIFLNGELKIMIN